MNRRTILPVLLVVSVCFNVFALAYGVTLTKRLPQRLVDPQPTDLGYRVAEVLPEPSGSKLRAELDAMRPEISDLLDGYRAAITRGAAVLDEETVDRDALAAAITEARDYRARIGDRLSEAFINATADLPVESRRELVRRFRER